MPIGQFAQKNYFSRRKNSIHFLYDGIPILHYVNRFFCFVNIRLCSHRKQFMFQAGIFLEGEVLPKKTKYDTIFLLKLCKKGL